MAEQLDLFKSKSNSVSNRFSKYIVYVDESGDHSLDSIDENYPVFVLAFCIFHKEHYCSNIVTAIERFKFKYFGHDHIVLHEREIRKEEYPFNIFHSKEERLNFIGELNEIIQNNNFVLTACIIDKKELKQKSSQDNPYHIALEYCLSTLFDFLKEKKEESKETYIIVEKRGDKEDKALELEFRRLCDEHGYPFKLRTADKKVNSSGLQLADLVARPIGINHLRPKQSNRAFDILKLKLYCSGGRNAVGVGYEGWGIKTYPQKSEGPR